MLVPKNRETLEPMLRTEDPDGRIIDCNEKYARMLGYPHDELIGGAGDDTGTTIFEHSPEFERERLNELFAKWKRGEDSYNVPLKMITRNGNVFTVMCTTKLVRDRDGKVIRTENMMLDKEEVKLFQDLVKERKFESLYDNSPDMYRTVNINGIIVDCNKAYSNKLGYEKDEIIGSNLTEHTANESVPAILINMAKWRLTHECNETNIFMKKRDGTKFPARVTPTNLYDDTGTLIGRNVVINDTTKEHEQRQLITERARIDREKNVFLANVTRELKMPLSPLLSFAGALAKPGVLGPMNQTQQQAIGAVVHNAKRLEALVVDLLHINEINSGQVRFEIREFDTARLIKKLKGMIKHEKVIEYVEAGDYRMTSDEYRIVGVLETLLDRSLDVTGDDAKISIAVRKKGEHVVFTITDNGELIEKKALDDIFTGMAPDTTRKKMQHGSGLGLIVCKNFIESLGGQITAKSHAKSGNVFTVKIPVTPPADLLQAAGT